MCFGLRGYPTEPMTDRRTFLAFCVTAGFAGTVAEALWNQLHAAPLVTSPGAPRSQQQPIRVTRAMVKAAEPLAGVQYTDAQRDLMLETLDAFLSAYEAMDSVRIPNSVGPATRFSAILPGRRPTGSTPVAGPQIRNREPVKRPASTIDLAFLPVTHLAELIRTRQVSSTELTRMYLERLRRFDPELKVIASITEERALRQAAEADRAIAAGRYKGPLHGIPYGVKDILAVPGYPTTWGATLYKNRILNTTATVVQRLDAAGAVLIAKLAMGELGLSDIWYGGQTKNPWRPEVGSTGSSSGSAVSTAMGLVGFAIGQETMGSIVGPANNNGVSALRPTFGRVSRHGSMNLCWSLDKIGPMARSVEDCAIILETIAGPDGRDPTVATVPYAWNPDRQLSSLRVGYFKWAFETPHRTAATDMAALSSLRNLGVDLIEIEMQADLPVNSLMIVRAEAAAALREVERDGGFETLKVQDALSWPNFARASHFIPAVEYIQANRLRTMHMQRFEEHFEKVDVIVAPTFSLMTLTNLTGHPMVVVPNGFGEEGIPTSMSFIGRLFGESEACTAARAWQDATNWHLRRPVLAEQ
jgi:Asp-tRNA(Asn)/Glu-tRNA(Gln) amidotransferase A subunit family amidase